MLISNVDTLIHRAHCSTHVEKSHLKKYIILPCFYFLGPVEGSSSLYGSSTPQTSQGTNVSVSSSSVTNGGGVSMSTMSSGMAPISGMPMSGQTPGTGSAGSASAGSISSPGLGGTPSTTSSASAAAAAAATATYAAALGNSLMGSAYGTTPASLIPTQVSH